MENNINNNKVEKLFNFNDLGPDKSSLLRVLEERCLEKLKSFSYNLIDPPILESSDLFFRKSLGNTSSSTYTFTDFSNQQVSLRPDFTASAIRLIFSEEVTAEYGMLNKVCYSGPVFRHSIETNDPIQIYQVGSEYLGSKGVESDTEILKQAISCLGLSGVNKYKLTLGHVGILRKFLEYTVQSEPIIDLVMSNLDILATKSKKNFLTKARMLNLIRDEKSKKSRSDYSIYENKISGNTGLRSKDDILKRLNSKIDNQVYINDLEDCIGSVEKILHLNLKDMLNGKLQSLANFELDDLVNVTENLLSKGIDSNNIKLDFSLTRNLAYYSGIVFNIKTDDDLCVLGGGGRYDDLPKRLGYEYEDGCSGFALNLSRIVDILGRK